MQSVLFGTAIVGGAFFLLSSRRVDLFTLAFASSCVYFLPGFFGAVPDGGIRDATVPLENDTYLVMSLVLAAVMVGAWMFDPHGVVRPRDDRAFGDRIASQVALAMSIVGLVMALRSSEGDLYSADKGDVLSAMSRWFYLYGVSASLAAVFAFINRQWATLALAVGLLLFSVYIGFRLDLAMTVIAVFLLYFNVQGPQRFLARNQFSVMVALAAAMFFFSYKFVYRMVKLGEYQAVAECLVDPEFHLHAIADSEPFATQMILNEVLRSQFATDAGYIAEGLAVQGILFSERLGLEAVGFNELFQPALFPEIEWGMAGNIWAQMLAAGGWPLLLMFLAIFILTLRMGSRWLLSAHLSTRAAVALGGSYWAFYIHRNDLAYAVMLEKRVVLMWLVIVVFSEALNHLSARGRPASVPDRRWRGNTSVRI